MKKYSYFGAASVVGAVKKVANKTDEVINYANEIAALKRQLNAVNQTAERAHDSARAGIWGKVGPVMEAVGLATLPLSLAPMFMKSADTRALEGMREEERVRQKMGLSRLPMTDEFAKKIQELPSPSFNHNAQRSLS